MLVATDLSEWAGRAVRRATQLAQQHQARLTALHVLPSGLDAELTASAQAAFDVHLTCFAGDGPAQRIIRSDTPATEIIAEAARRSAGLSSWAHTESTGWLTRSWAGHPKICCASAEFPSSSSRTPDIDIAQ